MTIIKVEDMHCEHCKMNIEKALKRKGISADINLEKHTISLEDEKAKEAIEVIKEAGYTPTI